MFKSSFSLLGVQRAKSYHVNGESYSKQNLKLTSGQKTTFVCGCTQYNRTQSGVSVLPNEEFSYRLN